MYESPITQIMSDISSQIRREQDGRLIYEVQQAIGYDIDRVELIKALSYDRDQYQKGYEDGRKDNEWQPVSEGLPDKNVLVLTYVDTGTTRTYCLALWNDYYKAWEEGIGGYRLIDRDLGYQVLAWRPLPDPYNSESESEE